MFHCSILFWPEKKKHPQASNDPLLPKIAILTAYWMLSWRYAPASFTSLHLAGVIEFPNLNTALWGKSPSKLSFYNMFAASLGIFLQKKKFPISWPFPSWEGFLFSTHFFTTHFDKTWTCSSYVGKETSICTSEKFPGCTRAKVAGIEIAIGQQPFEWCFCSLEVNHHWKNCGSFLDDGKPLRWTGTSRVYGKSILDLAVHQFPQKSSYSPKTNMEPENHPFEKENHLPSTSIFGFKLLVFRGCIWYCLSCRLAKKVAVLGKQTYKTTRKDQGIFVSTPLWIWDWWCSPLEVLGHHVLAQFASEFHHFLSREYIIQKEQTPQK